MPDVQDILSSHVKTASSREPSLRDSSAAAPKRPKLPRELQGLVGEGWESAATLQPSTRPNFRAKRNTNINWKWSRIQSSARRDNCLATEKTDQAGEDDVHLRHWYLRVKLLSFFKMLNFLGNASGFGSIIYLIISSRALTKKSKC